VQEEREESKKIISLNTILFSLFIAIHSEDEIYMKEKRMESLIKFLLFQ